MNVLRATLGSGGDDTFIELCGYWFYLLPDKCGFTARFFVKDAGVH